MGFDRHDYSKNREGDRDLRDIRLEEVQLVRRALKDRSKILGHDLFRDPAWDMLLALFEAELREQPVAVTQLTIESGVPFTTGLRYIERLQKAGLVDRKSDPKSRRRNFVSLSAVGRETISKWFYLHGRSA